MNFRGKVLRGGQVVLDPVEGDLWERTTATGRKEWGGSFPMPRGTPLQPRVTYRLALDDGRQGDFFVTRQRPQADLSWIVEFEGMGDWQ
jgi:hypothetical protein